MRSLLIVLTGFLVSGGAILALLLAAPDSTNANQPVAMSGATMVGSMSNGSMMSTSSATARGSMTAAPTTASPAAVKLTIQHVQRGCHVWSNGMRTGAMMRLHLQAGQKLAIVDDDVDAHQMMERSGPMHLQLGRPMMLSHGTTIAFPKKGVYRLATRTVEMPGGGMDVKTTGPDNNLRLVVTVA